ncbi:MAG: PKD domain-containing protein [Flavihumibacter sp.]
MLVLSLLHFQSAFTQQNSISLSPAVGTIVSGYLEHLPQDYVSNPSKKYPLMIFCHGIGEVGDGSAESLEKVKRNGPPNLIEKGAFPASFTVNGQAFSFIVISPQFNKTYVPAARLSEFIDWVVAKYRVDESRIYVTGLSMGGGVTWVYATDNTSYAKRLAAIVPVCGANTPSEQKAAVMASQNLPIWALHNDGDPTVHVNNSINYVKYVNAYTPAANPQARLTVWSSNSHNAWSKAYDPAYREEGKNVYEWMLQYTRAAGQPQANTPVPSVPVTPNQAPTARAGNDISISLPANTAILDGSGSTDPDGQITAYAWKQLSGPAATLTNAGSAIATAQFQVAGNYSFQLTVTDNDNTTGADTVSVTVLEAENTAPFAFAGDDTTLQLPDASLVLNGSQSYDSDGTLQFYRWQQTSGAPVTIASPDAASTVVSGFAAAGSYSFSLTVTDNRNAAATASVTVTVKEAVVVVPEPVKGSPIANAGPAITVKLPIDSVGLDASRSTDEDGKIVAYKWTALNGIKLAIQNANYPRTKIINMVPGTYQVELMVTDNEGKDR